MPSCPDNVSATSNSSGETARLDERVLQGAVADFEKFVATERGEERLRNSCEAELIVVGEECGDAFAAPCDAVHDLGVKVDHRDREE
jgi:hypothetical protein